MRITLCRIGFRNVWPEDSAILHSMQLARLAAALYGELIEEQAQPHPDCYALVEKALGAKNGVFAHYTVSALTDVA
jgi:hypothetical protein